MTRTESEKQSIGDRARETLERCKVEIGADFHALPRSAADALLAEAKMQRYQKPRNANGSRTRYFHAMIQRRALWYSPAGISRIVFAQPN